MKVKFTDNTDRYLTGLQGNLKTAMTDIKNDLVNTQRSAAPHKRGQLEKGIHGTVKGSGLSYQITVTASAKNSRGKDYAERMDSGNYALGKQSRAKGTGYSGISGKSFKVGQGYFTEPVKQNFSAYQKHLESSLKKSEI